MAKRHPVRNSQFMMAIRDVHSYFQEESFKIRNNKYYRTQRKLSEFVPLEG
jgi:hypothetical protein